MPFGSERRPLGRASCPQDLGRCASSPDPRARRPAGVLVALAMVQGLARAR